MNKLLFIARALKLILLSRKSSFALLAVSFGGAAEGEVEASTKIIALTPPRIGSVVARAYHEVIAQHFA